MKRVEFFAPIVPLMVPTWEAWWVGLAALIVVVLFLEWEEGRMTRMEEAEMAYWDFVICVVAGDDFAVTVAELVLEVGTWTCPSESWVAACVPPAEEASLYLVPDTSRCNLCSMGTTRHFPVA